MQATLASGLTHTERVEIDAGRTIAFLGESMRIYSTPSMVHDIEYTALHMLDRHLDEGESTVGIHVSVDHLGATPAGQWVDIALTVTEVEERKVTLEVEVRDAIEVVGRGRHVRFVIDKARLARRVQQKARGLDRD